MRKIIAFTVLPLLCFAFGQLDAQVKGKGRLQDPLTALAPTGPAPQVPGDVIQGPVPHLGGSPSGTTIDASDNLYVADQFTGDTYVYDLNLVNTGMIPTA